MWLWLLVVCWELVGWRVSVFLACDGTPKKKRFAGRFGVAAKCVLLGVVALFFGVGNRFFLSVDARNPFLAWRRLSRLLLCETVFWASFLCIGVFVCVFVFFVCGVIFVSPGLLPPCDPPSTRSPKCSLLCSSFARKFRSFITLWGSSGGIVAAVRGHNSTSRPQRVVKDEICGGKGEKCPTLRARLRGPHPSDPPRSETVFFWRVSLPERSRQKSTDTQKNGFRFVGLLV